MLNRMTRGLASLVGAAGLSCAIGAAIAGSAGAATHHARPEQVKSAATPACGTFCVNYFVQEFDSRFVLNDYRGHKSAGTRVLLYPPSNTNLDEDWTVWPAGTVSELASFGLVSRSLALHYGADHAFELQFAPYGVGSGLCAGVARAATSGESVTLQWCGQSARTIWVLDAANASGVSGGGSGGPRTGAGATGGYAPLINGSDTNFSDPQVLTEPAWPLSQPRPGLVTSRLQEFADGAVYDDQMWDNSVGALP
jgi:hypothetical protein